MTRFMIAVKPLVTLSIFLLSATLTLAQTTIKGIVRNKTEGKGIAGVSVTVKDKKASGMLSYAITDDKGRYELHFTHAADSLLIAVSGFNMEKQNRTVVNHNQQLDFEINSQAIKLKEIKVNPPKIRKLNDTISYLVDGFKDGNDRTIGDVLRKLPGIEVKADGSILYNNKPINKFYIENKDLLQGRYGIATNNIEAKDVASVQILENHQPVKALKNREFTDEAALNLKLKDNAKGVLIANAKIGAGLSPLLWNNELFSMYFNKGRQNMNTYKGNNTGNDPGSDFNSYYTDLNKLTNTTLLAVQSPSAPAISQPRYLFNRAHAFSINNLWTSGKDNQVNLNMNYLNDVQKKSSFSRSIYYLPVDSVLTVEERLSSSTQINQLDASLQFNTNKDQYYLDNVLTFKGKWDQTTGTVMQTDEVLQGLYQPAYAFANTLNMIRNYKKVSFKVYSYNVFNSTPQTLTVKPLLYTDLFGESKNFNAMRQEIAQNRFLSKSRISFGSTANNWKQNYSVGINASLQQFKSDLQAQSQKGSLSSPIDSLRNNLQWNKYELYFNPDYTYVFSQFRLTADLPLSFNTLHTRDGLTMQPKNTSRLFFNPQFKLNYELNLFLNLSATANYDHQLGEINQVFTGIIMQSYRYLVRNNGQLPKQQNQSYILDLNYRHPIHAVFANFGMRYFNNKTNLLYGYDYEGILSTKKTYDLPNRTEGYSFNTRISKGIDAINGTVTLEASYMNTSSTQISQNQLINFRNRTHLIKPGISTKIQSWLSLTSEFQLTKSTNDIRSSAGKPIPIRASTERTQLNLFPVKGWVVNLAHEYFYTNVIATGNRTMHFADIHVKYTYKNMEFSVDYNNILNAKQYISASYNEISTYYSAYDLRPAQVILGFRFKIK